MKIHLYAYSLVVLVLDVTSCCLGGGEIWKITDLRLIIPEHFIKEHCILRPDSDWASLKPKESHKLRKEICEKLIHTPYFVKYHLRWIDADSDEQRDYVLRTYPNTLSSNFRRKGSWFSGRQQYYYDNTYRLASTDLNSGRENPYSINVFPCLVERTIFMSGQEMAKRVQEYFVSEPFHVDAPQLKVVDVVGRVVFTPYLETENLRIEAFAAEAGKWLKDLKISRLDVENKYGLFDLAKLGDRPHEISRDKDEPRIRYRSHLSPYSASFDERSSLQNYNCSTSSAPAEENAKQTSHNDPKSRSTG